MAFELNWFELFDYSTKSQMKLYKHMDGFQ